MKRLFCAIILCLFAFAAYSQQERPPIGDNDKRLFYKAETAFEDQKFGDAIWFAQQAKEARRSKVDHEKYTLENSFKPYEVKRHGDVLSEIIAVLEERQDYEALGIIRPYFRLPGEAFFGDSKQKLFDYIQNHREYPEADYLIGKIYNLEGDYKLAYDYMRAAYRHADILDVPAMQYDILYSLAQISLVQKEYERYENDLLLIVSEDEALKNKTLLNAMKKTLAGKKNDCVDKFFSMYRSSHYRLLAAYFDLAEYYESRNENERFLEVSALGAVTGFTKILDVIRKRDPEYEYTSFALLLQEAALHEDIVLWGIENNVWKGFNDLAEAACKNLDMIFAVRMYDVLRQYSPELYWKEQADERLKEITGQK